ncbi:hypothetical protein N1851_033715 [Merluccius polli]|uniref:Uncharacterized protein n=1 Tax=Merluccius polli TaxID=89951 RepID=A0AA47NNC9_MERPO|nr:hypothetical protein N1851_033715 [Merluccius polli]
MTQLLSVGMDGPNVNFKLLDLLQKAHAELYGGAQVLMVGSCGLHTLHNAMKAGFTAWQIDKLLRALHFLFHNVPARREDYTNITGSSCFPLSFCGHRWVENVPVAERVLEVWPMIQKYVDAAEAKKVQKPNTASYDAILAAQSLLRRFIKRELLQDRTPLQLIKLDISEEKNWVSLKRVDIGLGAESAIKAILGKPGTKIGELSVLQLRKECLQCLIKIVKKLQE